MPIVYLNGQFMPDTQATVSVWDRGFIFGDGIYEVIPAYGGRLFRLDEHLERLDHSLAGIRLANPHDRARWRVLLDELVVRNGGGDLSVYLQITRGAARRDHAFPIGVPPTVFLSASPFPVTPAEMLEQGVAVITVPDIRWQYCNLKTIALLPNVLLRQQAIDAGAAEAVLIRDGEVTEGAASNVFIVRDGVVITPPKGPHLLPGITRDLVLELTLAEGLPCREGAILANDLACAQEIWLTSSIREILPVTRLDGRPVGDGRPGPLWARMFKVYQDYKQRLRERGE